jgi:hypothetical protein
MVAFAGGGLTVRSCHKAGYGSASLVRVSVDALPPEVARRDAEAGEWVLIGQESGIADDHPERVEVLGGPLVPPAAG